MEIREVRRILVTIVGSLTVPATIRGLKKEGCYVAGTDVDLAELFSESVEVQASYQLPRCDVRERHLQKLSVVVQREQTDGTSPLTDVELDVLDTDTEQFGSILLFTPSEELLQRVRHREQSKEVAEATFHRTGNERFVATPTLHMPRHTGEGREQ